MLRRAESLIKATKEFTCSNRADGLQVSQRLTWRVLLLLADNIWGGFACLLLSPTAV